VLFDDVSWLRGSVAVTRRRRELQERNATAKAVGRVAVVAYMRYKI
jgi:hypothetical protein